MVPSLPHCSCALRLGNGSASAASGPALAVTFWYFWLGHFWTASDVQNLALEVAWIFTGVFVPLQKLENLNLKCHCTSWIRAAWGPGGMELSQWGRKALELLDQWTLLYTSLAFPPINQQALICRSKSAGFVLKTLKESWSLQEFFVQN